MQRPKAQNRDLSGSAFCLVIDVFRGGLKDIVREGLLMTSAASTAGEVEYHWGCGGCGGCGDVVRVMGGGDL